MKKIFLLSLIQLLAFVVYAQTDSVTIFRPSAGLNDSTNQGGINGGKDAFVYQMFPDTNYAAAPYMIAAPLSDCNLTFSKNYIQFDVSGLPSIIDSAFVGFTHFPDTVYCLSNCVADFYFAYVTEQWYVQTITYGNMPTQDTGYFYGPVHITFPNNFGTKEYNITSMYNQWRSGAIHNYGMVIYSNTMGCNNAAVSFYVHTSDDSIAANRPYLKVYSPSVPGFVQTQLASHLNLNVYPNPSTSEITVSFALATPGDYKLVVTDMTGRTVFEASDKNVSENIRISIPLQHYCAGMYLLNLYTPEGKLTGKVIRQ